MTMTSQVCPQCGGELPAGRTEGLCPKCLLQQGLLTNPPTVAPTQSSDRDEGLPAFVAASPEELAPFFPQLQILELLGVGGMGAVYKARQASLDRLVALKVLPREVGRDPTFAERFRREARALASLNHPNIVTIHDIGQAEGLYYIIMEYIDGANLRQIIHTKTLSPEQTLALVPQMCEALQYAHDEGVVHRDIKPENILVDKRGRAKIADFGLAKILGDRVLDTSLTGTQQVMGTLRYMAPEQMMGARDVDHRADIYALGVVFYELLTGELPLGRFPLPSERTPCDARLDEVVLKALERERERRYQQAQEIKTDVESISKTYRAGTSSPPASPAKVAPQHVHNALSHDDFEQAADEVRAPAGGLLLVSSIQAVVLVGMIIYFVVTYLSYYGNDFVRATSLTWVAGPLGAGFLLHLPVSLLMLPAAVQMQRLRSYEFALIASLLAMLPLGATCIFTFPLGLWSLLVLLRPNVRQAFHTPLRNRPERWQARDAELLANRRRDPAAYQRAYERVAVRVRAAGVGMLLMSLFDLVATGIVLVSLVTQSRGAPPVLVMFMLVGIPAVATLFTIAGAICMLRMRGLTLAIAGAAVGIAPLSILGWVRWMIGLWALLTLLRRDVRLAFAQDDNPSQSPPDDGTPAKSQVAAPGVYDATRSTATQRLGTPPPLLVAGMLAGAALLTAGLVMAIVALLSRSPLNGTSWGYLGAAFGCIAGGIGSLVGCWNDYRQHHGERNLMVEPQWTWFDEGVCTFLVLGVLLLLASPFAGHAGGRSAGLTAAIIGGLMMLQGGWFTILRAYNRNRLRRMLGETATEEEPSWDVWWRERSTWFRQMLGSLALVSFLLCLVLFLSFEYTSGEQHGRVSENHALVKIGQPSPWLEIARRREPTGVMSQSIRFNWLSWSWLYGIAALCLLELTATTRRWEKPGTQAAIMVRGVLTGITVVLAFALAMFVNLALKEPAPVVTPSATAPAEAPVPAVMPPATSAR